MNRKGIIPLLGIALSPPFILIIFGIIALLLPISSIIVIEVIDGEVYIELDKIPILSYLMAPEFVITPIESFKSNNYEITISIDYGKNKVVEFDGNTNLENIRIELKYTSLSLSKKIMQDDRVVIKIPDKRINEVVEIGKR